MKEKYLPIDSLSTIDQKINHLGKYIEEISCNTNAFDGKSQIITWTAFAASVITIAGVIILFWELRQRKTSKEWQKRIILDLIRHFMVNNAIIEVIRSRTLDMPDSYHPIEGVLSRFATLDSDTDLARFAVNEKNYEKIHNLSLKIRNYNSVVTLADKHFCDKNYPREAKEQELRSIFKRSIGICERLTELCTSLKNEVNDSMIRKYTTQDRYNACRIKKWQKQGAYCEEFRILQREDFPEHKYYDEKGLSDTFDHLIRHQAALIQFIDY